jgi:hypothetical protein
MHMAMADRMTRANPMDARIPCPVCGQDIHPVAGRCKHCKTDLVKLREARGVRAPRIDPAVIGVAAVAPAVQPTAAAPESKPEAAPIVPPTNGHTSHLLPPVLAYDAPEIAGSMPVRSSLARRWPILVAILAGIAIVVCAYILLLAPDTKAAAARPARRDTTPAPDRMDTMPAPNHLPDPWGGQGSQGGTPQLPPNFDDPPAPGQAPPPNPPANPPTLQPGAVPSAEDYFSTLQDKACEKLQACGLGGQMGQAMCELLGDASIADQTREMVRAGRCTYDETKAAACFSTIESVQCKSGSLDLDQIPSLIMSYGDCAEALRCQ